jgi:hypothetical protein
LRGSYLMDMLRRIWLIGLLVFTTIAWMLPAHAQSDDDRYTIMRPETTDQSVPPKYKSPRAVPQHVVIPQPSSAPLAKPAVPPPIYVPQTGQLLPNIPTIAPAGPGGAETSQDRAVRCAHQAGVYGQAAGDHNAYIGGCINQ